MTEANKKRGRGRPKGRSARYAGDEKVLEAMADAITKEPKSNPTQVARQLGKISDADIVRLRRQFKKRQVELLMAARKRRDERVSRVGGSGGPIGSGGYAHRSYLDQLHLRFDPLGEAYRRAQEAVNPILQSMHDQFAGPVGAVQEMQRQIDRQVKEALGDYGYGSSLMRANSAVDDILRREEQTRRMMYGHLGSPYLWDRF